MSLLNKGTEVVKVYPEEAVLDDDGNVLTRAAVDAVPVRASVQPIGTPTEDDQVGFQSTSRYRLRLVSGAPALGAQSQVEWRGLRFAVVGDPIVYTGSARTARVEYVIERK
ncbi:MAG: hypothetical protein JST91_08655 [Actinobacteria bacterium]|nr:hypothetical protein [Actinomycetota bacterium]